MKGLGGRYTLVNTVIVRCSFTNWTITLRSGAEFRYLELWKSWHVSARSINVIQQQSKSSSREVHMMQDFRPHLPYTVGQPLFQEILFQPNCFCPSAYPMFVLT
jgi:hypothetical protein